MVISTDSAPDQLSDVLDPFIHANAVNPDRRGKGRAAAGGVLVLVVGGAGGGHWMRRDGINQLLAARSSCQVLASNLALMDSVQGYLARKKTLLP